MYESWLDGQVNTITQIINSLPAGQDRNHLTDEFTTLKTNARHILRDALPRLSLSERLITTDELRRLGDVVTQLNHAVITFSLRSSIQVTISLRGDNLYPGGRLLINNTLIAGNGILHNGTYTFIVAWNSKQPPQTIGILNTDGTIAQTTAIILPNSGGNEDNGKNHVIQNIENKIQNRFGSNNDGQSGKDKYNTGVNKEFKMQNGNNHNGNSNNYVHK